MTPERWREISTLLDQVLALPLEERAAWLEREVAEPDLRAEVSELAASAERAEGLLEGAAGAHLATLLGEDLDAGETGVEVEGKRIGPYRIVSEVGSGGMGVVYLAERADGQFENRVALKLVKPGFDGKEIVRRFERERRIVARLEHPAIARVLDGGVSGDGRPYFAMEFVDGEPLTAYCQRHALAIEERLRLFARACDAVQYAHGRLIVHRDLKPSNMLVDASGDLKLVDFGIAKVLSGEDTLELTRPGGERPFTPAYAAPEQLSGEPVTTATDVYALGIVLYELLVGRRPFESAGPNRRDVERAVLETDPLPPSRAVLSPEATSPRGVSPAALARRLSGDLDAIVTTALRRDPSARYASAEAFREDIESHLAHRPIKARAEGAAARAAKFVRRHRTGVTAVALVVLSLAAGLVATVSQARQKALEAQKAREVSDFVTGLFEAADPAQAQGKEITARELVEQGAARLERELAGQPEIQAEMGLVLGRINDRLGLSEAALALLDRAIERATSAGGPAASKTRADALRAKGAALVNLGRAEEAEPLLREAEAEHRRLPGAISDRDLEVAEDLDVLSIALRALGRLEESEAAVRQTFELRLPVLGPDHPEIASSYNNLAVVERELGRFDDAEANYQKALDIRRPALGEEHPATADTFNNLAALLYYRGRYVDAAAAFEEASRLYARIYGDEHPRTVTGLNNLATARLRLGELDRAEELYERVLAFWRKTASDQHPNALMTESNLGLLYQSRGESRRAEETAARTLEGAETVLGPSHPLTAVFSLRLASASRELGRYFRARELATSAEEVFEKAYGAEHPQVAASLEELGRIESEVGDEARAEAHLRQAVALRIAQGGSETMETLAARTALASVLRAQGNLDEAAGMLEADLATARRFLPGKHPLLIDLLLERGRTLAAAGRVSEAEPLLAEARELAIERYGSDNWRTALVDLRQAELLAASGRGADARSLAEKAEKVFREELGPDHPLALEARTSFRDSSSRP